jgi:hypothetical protein
MFRFHSFIPLLKFWLMPIFGLFAAGASALGGAAGETAGAIIDSTGSGDFGEGEGEGSGAGAGEGEGEGAGSGEGEGAAAAAQGGEGAQGDKGAADGRKMPAALRSHIAELKAAGKGDLAKEINTVFWGFKKLQSDLVQAFPGGLKEAVELKTQLEEAGGLDSIQELQGEIDEWRSVDEQLSNGDPNVVKTMFEQFPDGLKAVMPAALDNWANVDADGYDRHMAGVAYSTLNGSGIPTDLQLAYSLLEQYDLDKNPPLKRILGILAKSYNWIGNLGKFAAEKPAAAAGAGKQGIKDTKLTEREQRVAASERKQTISTISTNFQSFTTPKFESHLKDLFKDKAIPAHVNKQEVYKRAIANVFLVLGAGGNAAKGIKSQFEKKYDAYLDNGDQQGALKFLQSRAEPLMADAVSKAYKWLYRGESSGKGNGAGAGKGNAAAAAGKGGNAAAGDGSNADGGFVLIGYDPKPSSIDRSKTTNAMIFKNQAILKSGKRVTWKKGAPAER